MSSDRKDAVATIGVRIADLNRAIRDMESAHDILTRSLSQLRIDTEVLLTACTLAVDNGDGASSTDAQTAYTHPYTNITFKLHGRVESKERGKGTVDACNPGYLGSECPLTVIFDNPDIGKVYYTRPNRIPEDGALDWDIHTIRDYECEAPYEYTFNLHDRVEGERPGRGVVIIYSADSDFPIGVDFDDADIGMIWFTPAGHVSIDGSMPDWDIHLVPEDEEENQDHSASDAHPPCLGYEFKLHDHVENKKNGRGRVVRWDQTGQRSIAVDFDSMEKGVLWFSPTGRFSNGCTPAMDIHPVREDAKEG